MFERIVVPLDGSPFAEAALAPARELARTFRSRLLLVRAVSPAGLPWLVRRDAAGEPQVDLDAVDDAESYLMGLSQEMQAAGLAASFLLFIAEPGTGIANAAELTHADLIVMATHKRWTLDLTRSDSMTLQVLARSHVPILAWRPGAAVQPEGEKSGQAIVLPRPESAIVVPLDGSSLAESALPMAEALARTFGSSLALVRAVGHEAMDGTGSGAAPAPRDDTHDEFCDDELRVAQAYLDSVARNIAARDVRASVFVREGTPPSVIQGVAREQDAAVVVMASHGSRGRAVGFLDSVAGAMVEEGTTPVLVVRA